MRILITGGFGFVGGRLAQHLASNGHQIVLGSRWTSCPPSWLSKAEITQINWADNRCLEESCKGVDAIIHAAGMNAGECEADPLAALAFNGLATGRLVSAAVQAGVRRFCYLSTAHVYCSPMEGTITEETPTRNPHPYATSHLAGEYAVLRSHQIGKIEGIVLRLSNAFGSPMDQNVNCWMLLINDVCRQAATSGRVYLRTSGVQKRDFVTLHDVVRVVSHMIDLPMDELGDGLFNVGSGKSSRVCDMVELIRNRCEKVLGHNPEIIYPDLHKVNGEIGVGLNYRVDKLLRTGIKIYGSRVLEIDEILRMSSKNFIGVN